MPKENVGGAHRILQIRAIDNKALYWRFALARQEGSRTSENVIGIVIGDRL